MAHKEELADAAIECMWNDDWYGCKGLRMPELRIGDTAEVTRAGNKLKIRTSPAIIGQWNTPGNNIVHRLESGDKVGIVCGPVCNDDCVWWKVKYGVIEGWSAEVEKLEQGGTDINLVDVNK